MATTIQISEELQTELNQMKLFDRETYEDVLWNLVEDRKELGEETKRELEKAREDYKKGNFSTLEEVKKKAGL